MYHFPEASEEAHQAHVIGTAKEPKGTEEEAGPAFGVDNADKNKKRYRTEIAAAAEDQDAETKRSTRVKKHPKALEGFFA
jgi:hypothetical protein